MKLYLWDWECYYAREVLNTKEGWQIAEPKAEYFAGSPTVWLSGKKFDTIQALLNEWCSSCSGALYESKLIYAANEKQAKDVMFELSKECFDDYGADAGSVFCVPYEQIFKVRIEREGSNTYFQAVRAVSAAAYLLNNKQSKSKGGSAKTNIKQNAARLNGLKGGRPKTKV